MTKLFSQLPEFGKQRMDKFQSVEAKPVLSSVSTWFVILIELATGKACPAPAEIWGRRQKTRFGSL